MFSSFSAIAISPIPKKTGKRCVRRPWPSPADMDLLSALTAQGKIERIVSKEKWIDLFRSQEPEVKIRQDEALMPDFLAVAAQGYSFKAMGTTLRKPVHIPENNFKV